MKMVDANGSALVLLVDSSGNPLLYDSQAARAALYVKNAAVGDTALTGDATNGLDVDVTRIKFDDPVADLSGTAQAATVMAKNASGQRPLAVASYLYDGGFYLQRMNYGATLLAAAARTAAATANLTLHNHRGVLIVVKVTARAGATTLTPKLTLKGPVSGTYDFDIWQAAAAINSSAGTFVYYFYPGSVPGAAGLFTEEVDMAIPREVQLAVTPSDADSVTYSAGVYYLL